MTPRSASGTYSACGRIQLCRNAQNQGMKHVALDVAHGTVLSDKIETNNSNQNNQDRKNQYHTSRNMQSIINIIVENKKEHAMKNIGISTKPYFDHEYSKATYTVHGIKAKTGIMVILESQIIGNRDCGCCSQEILLPKHRPLISWRRTTQTSVMAMGQGAVSGPVAGMELLKRLSILDCDTTTQTILSSREKIYVTLWVVTENFHIISNTATL